MKYLLPFVTTVLLLAMLPDVKAQLLLNENFNYTASSQINNQGGWSAYSSIGTTPQVVTSTGLTYAGYGSSAIGNALQLQNNSGEDVSYPLSVSLGSGSIYVGFLINVASASTANATGATINFNGSGNATFRNSGFTFRNSAGNLQFGLSNSSTPTFATTNRIFSTTYFVVLEFDNSGSSGVFKLYINPIIDATKPASDLSITLGGGATLSSTISALQILQISTGVAAIDGIRVSTNWDNVVSSSAGGSTSINVFEENFSFPIGALSSPNWTFKCCGTTPTVVAGSLSFLSYGSSGVANSLSVLSSNQDPTYNFSNSPTTVFISFIFQSTIPNTTIRPYVDGSVCGGARSEFQSYTPIPTVDGVSTLHVLKFDLGQRRLDYIQYPANTTVVGIPEPSMGTLVSGWSPGCIDYVSDFVFEVASGGGILDGIRVGPTWADVMSVEAPVFLPSSVTLTPNVNSNQISFPNAVDLPTGYLVARKAGSTTTFIPADNTIYSVGTTQGDATIVGTASNSITDNFSVSPETNYFYSIFPYNSGGGVTKYLTTSSTSSAFTYSIEPSSAPASFASSSPSNSQIDLSFSAASTITNADGYIILRRSDGAFPTATNITDGVAPGFLSLPTGTSLAGIVTNSTTVTFNDTGLNAFSTYHYTIIPYNSDGTNDQTYNYFTASLEQTTGLTRPNAPTASYAVGNASNVRFSAQWTLVTGATGYELDVSTSPSFSPIVYQDLAIGPAETSTLATGLSGNTTYYFRVRAKNTSGASANSLTVLATTAPNPPAPAAATNVSNVAFTANWATSAGATKYFLDISTSNIFSTFLTGFNNLDVGTNLSLVVNSGLAANTIYYYRLRSFNANGTSNSSSNGTLTTAPLPPVPTAASAFTQTGLTASWNASTGAAGYRLDISLANDFSSFVTGYNNLAIAGTSSVVTGLSSGTNYFYRVRAEGGSGTSLNSSVVTALTVPPNPVVATTVSPTQTSFGITSISTSATDFRLDVSTNNFSSTLPAYTNLSIGTTMPYLVTGLTPGTTYQWRIKATNSSGTSGNSTDLSVLTIPPNPVANAASTFTQTSFTANWNSATSATSYRLDVATDNGFNNLVVNNSLVAGTSFSITGLTAGTTYHYRVRAVNASGTSGNSNTITTVTVPGTPVAISPTAISSSTFTANWNATTGASTYALDYSLNSNLSSSTTINNISGTSVTISGLTANTNYYYAVRAINSSGTSGNSNIINTLTVTAAPVAGNATSATASGFTANWTTVSGATGYRLDVAPNSGFTNLVVSDQVVAGLSFNVTGLNAGNVYYYRVRAVNGSGSSANSNVVSQITISPAPVATDATVITTSGFTANWQSAAGAASYQLDVSADNYSTFMSGYNNLSVAGTSQIVTGLSEGVTYQYRVRAVNAAGISINSNSISIITVPPVPTANAATSILSNGFTANWSSVSGATQYLLDVSTDNFSTFLATYNSKELTTTTEAVAGLQPNTVYQYRIRAKSSSGTSANSNVISVLTLPPASVANAPTQLTQTSFLANWGAVTGITEFRLDVSSDDFATRVTGYDNLLVTGTSRTISGLIPGVSYKYRIRSQNATGVSVNSNSISALTIPATPVAVAAFDVTQTGFTAKWNAVTGHDAYVLDVSLSSSFAGTIPGYAGIEINKDATQEILSSLISGTTYYYRLRSKNASGISPNSNVISQIIIPKTPEPNPVPDSQIGSNSFTATWAAVPGAEGYEIDVTLTSSNFTTFVPNYNSAPIPGNEVEITVSGLAPATSYYFRLRAVNAGGKSPNSIRRGATTKGGQTFGVSITSTTTTNAQVQINNPVGAVQANLFYRGIAEISLKPSKPIAVTGAGTYQVNLEESMFDELGVSFFVKAVDEGGIEKTTETKEIFRSFTSSTSPTVINSNFEGTRSSMRIISIPYDLKDNLIESIFASLGAYDKKNWRLAHYVEGEGNVEFREGINKIERGQGYWFNARGAVNIKSGEGTVGQYTTTNPYKLNLVSGWNQIGNPYPFAIDWSDVLADNPGSGVGNLKIYDGSKGNYDNGNKMEPFTGGFVRATNPVTLDVKVTLKNTANGGRQAGVMNNRNVDEPSWRLPLRVSQGDLTYGLSKIGMEPTAKWSLDSYDEIRLPRLDEYLDITFEHPESKFKYFTEDIVPAVENAVWSFTIASNSASPKATLQWDNEFLLNTRAEIKLFDVNTARWIDMKSINQYSFNNTGQSTFRIYFSKTEVMPDIMTVSSPFPNVTDAPFSIELTLPLHVTDHSVKVTLHDITGKEAIKIFDGIKPAGVHTIEGNGIDQNNQRLPSGLYLIRTCVNDHFLPPQRLMIRN